MGRNRLWRDDCGDRDRERGGGTMTAIETGDVISQEFEILDRLRSRHMAMGQDIWPKDIAMLSHWVVHEIKQLLLPGP